MASLPMAISFSLAKTRSLWGELRLTRVLERRAIQMIWRCLLSPQADRFTHAEPAAQTDLRFVLMNQHFFMAAFILCRGDAFRERFERINCGWMGFFQRLCQVWFQ